MNFYLNVVELYITNIFRTKLINKQGLQKPKLNKKNWILNFREPKTHLPEVPEIFQCSAKKFLRVLIEMLIIIKRRKTT